MPAEAKWKIQCCAADATSASLQRRTKQPGPFSISCRGESRFTPTSSARVERPANKQDADTSYNVTSPSAKNVRWPEAVHREHRRIADAYQHSAIEASRNSWYLGNNFHSRKKYFGISAPELTCDETERMKQ
jgi:hypothetical protein